jgi:uncharacterized protein
MTNFHRTYHEGEVAVQDRAGVSRERPDAEEMYHPAIGIGVARFLAAQQFAAISSMDGDGRVWVSLRSGQPGFLQAVDRFTAEIAGYSHPDDPLLANLRQQPGIGILAINLAARQRVRLNGKASLSDSVICMTVEQLYGNCQQYIQARAILGQHEPVSAAVRHHDELDARLRSWVESSDTFFLGTAHPQSGLDASHRGGKPGFVRVESAKRLDFPDYRGNKMFNSLGNISSYAKAGLLFPDFDSGAALLVSGTANILWDSPQIADFPGARRLVAIDVERILELPQATLLKFEFRNYSPDLR